MIHIRPARADEIAAVRDIERVLASRFLGTDRAELAQDEPTDAATLARRVEAGGLLVAADGDAPYQRVLDAMAALQRANVTNVSLMTDAGSNAR